MCTHLCMTWQAYTHIHVHAQVWIYIYICVCVYIYALCSGCVTLYVSFASHVHTYDISLRPPPPPPPPVYVIYEVGSLAFASARACSHSNSTMSSHWTFGHLAQLHTVGAFPAGF